jgi:hypothetical protein
MSKIEVDAIDKQSGSTVTIGGSGTNVVLGTCGQTVSLGTGASQSGFGRTGTVNWQTTVKTAGFTAANGEGYFVNTTSGGITINLPAGSAGSIVAFKDYASTWDTNAVTLTPNGSDKIKGVNSSASLSTENQSVTLIFVDSTKGWLEVHDSSADVSGSTFICASVSGACNTLATVDTNFKVATFTGPGTFTINSGTGPLAKLDYMVIAGGGGGGIGYSSGVCGGGGGAGGFRESHCATVSGPYTASPLASPTSLSLAPGAFPITIGGGGTGRIGCSGCGNGPNVTAGDSGSNTVFSTITSAGGGGGGGADRTSGSNAKTGGSGGGGGSGSPYPSCAAGAGASGNTPPVSPPQGNNGGNGPGAAANSGGGGGGATAVGGNRSDPSTGGAGGAGATTSISGSPVARAGGGGGSGNTTLAAGGAGGGGVGARYTPGCNAGVGTVNTGGGGGGGVIYSRGAGGNGGSGIVIIRYKFQ